ncbi:MULTISPECIES: hydroxymethylglutaryl-CoA lyase [Prauserella salsuginis group]|uniref:Hydroxymethylglutaryl-CoA lyase n=1 Tax=Prauserella salsuginis TaxID=387889 RepID=A0ABW6GBL1_9PSEU|nr:MULTISPECIES: hydroxymethylglutaryl-CoA lyase [Prauserella salsuginis group]MCR3721902.1 hydroxymethylglutaryl-CoA lyase [Prauserella flava]MCR3735907.1 hydroxymethylglutaryl-CoA lyase [Prauserella salsuginis]
MNNPNVVLTDVVLRDGLQDEPVVVPVADRAAIAEALVAAGLRNLEAASFVNPDRVPQMAGAEDLLSRLPDRDTVRYSVLALNARGVARAAAAGADEITVVASASPGHSRANAGRDVDAALDDLAATIAANPHARFTAGISTAFVCPFDGDVPPSTLVAVAERFARMGIRRIGLADTLGTAEPDQVLRSLAAVREALPDVDLGLHLHNARGQALSTVDAAVSAGIARFDSATGGYGGCPFAPGAHGNIATEELVAHLHARGIPTGIDEHALAEAATLIKDTLARATVLT